MRWLADRIMQQRARRLFRRLAPHLSPNGTIADLGSGTGHNAQEIRLNTTLQVVEYDVCDLHWVGPGPTLLSSDSIPEDEGCYQSVMLLFVLQYPNRPADLLKEARRITRGRVIVVQSTYSGTIGLTALRVREFFWGRFALQCAAVLGLVVAKKDSLRPRHYFTRPQLQTVFQDAGLVIRVLEQSTWPGLSVSRDLFVLEAAEA